MTNRWSNVKTDAAHVVEVIETVVFTGAGTEEDPIIDLHQYWSLDGQLLAERRGDPKPANHRGVVSNQRLNR